MVQWLQQHEAEYFLLRNKLRYWLHRAEPDGWMDPIGAAAAAAADDDGSDDAAIMKHYCHLYSRRP